MRYLAVGQPQRAIELLEYVVNIRNDILDQNDFIRLMSQHDLAIAYQRVGQAQRAIKLLEYLLVSPTGFSA
jgi:tetratricopeptide (TPR) repeat protein